MLSFFITLFFVFLVLLLALRSVVANDDTIVDKSGFYLPPSYFNYYFNWTSFDDYYSTYYNHAFDDQMWHIWNDDALTVYAPYYDDIFEPWVCTGVSSCSSIVNFNGFCCRDVCCQGASNCCNQFGCSQCGPGFFYDDLFGMTDDYYSWQCGMEICYSLDPLLKPNGCCGEDCCYGDNHCCDESGHCSTCSLNNNDIKKEFQVTVGAIVGLLVGGCILAVAICSVAAFIYGRYGKSNRQVVDNSMQIAYYPPTVHVRAANTHLHQVLPQTIIPTSAYQQYPWNNQANEFPPPNSIPIFVHSLEGFGLRFAPIQESVGLGTIPRNQVLAFSVTPPEGVSQNCSVNHEL